MVAPALQIVKHDTIVTEAQKFRAMKGNIVFQLCHILITMV